MTKSTDFSLLKIIEYHLLRVYNILKVTNICLYSKYKFYDQTISVSFTRPAGDFRYQEPIQSFRYMLCLNTSKC